MEILSFKSGHDGTIAFIKNEKLIFSIEAEKDSFPRYSDPHAELFLKAMSHLDRMPNVIALSGWRKKINNNVYQNLGSGYFDIKKDSIISHERKFFGQSVNFF